MVLKKKEVKRRRSSVHRGSDNITALALQHKPSFSYLVVHGIIDTFRDVRDAGAYFVDSAIVSPVYATVSFVKRVCRKITGFPKALLWPKKKVLQRDETLSLLDKRVRSLEREVKRLNQLRLTADVKKPSPPSNIPTVSIAPVVHAPTSVGAPHPPPLPPPPPPPPSIRTSKPAIFKPVKPIADVAVAPNEQICAPTLDAIISQRGQLRKRVPMAVIPATTSMTLRSHGQSQPTISLKDITNVRLKKISPKKKNSDSAPLSFTLRKVDILRSPGGTPLRRDDAKITHQSPKSPYELRGLR